MRIASSLLLLATALPLHAAPPAPPATSSTPSATRAPHSPIGEVMGSLTRALREAAEQQSHATAPPGAMSVPATPSRTPQNDIPAPLPPDATAQVAVP